MKLLTLSLALVAVTFSCGKKDNDNSTEMPAMAAEGHQDHSEHAGHEHGDHGQAMDVQLSENKLFSVDAQWGTPLQSGESMNVIVIHLKSPDDSELGSVNLTSVTTFMTIHGHGSDHSSINIVKDPSMDNMWIVHGIKFQMAGEAGEWQLKLETEVDGVSEHATYTIMEAVN